MTHGRTKAQVAALIRCASGLAYVHPTTAGCLISAGLLSSWDMSQSICQLTQKGRGWILQWAPQYESQLESREEWLRRNPEDANRCGTCCYFQPQDFSGISHSRFGRQGWCNNPGEIRPRQIRFDLKRRMDQLSGAKPDLLQVWSQDGDMCPGWGTRPSENLV